MVVARFVALLLALIGAATADAVAAPSFIPVLEPGDLIPPLALVGQDGRAFSLADLRGRAVALSFIYTRCADARMCPLVTAKFARAQAEIGSAPVHLVLVTLDPDYDTPAVLARYGRSYGQDPGAWTLATGSATALAELAGRLGIATSVLRPGSISHTEAAVIVAPDGRIAQTIFGNAWTAAEIVAAARAAVPGGTDRLAGLRGWLRAAAARCGSAGSALSGTGMLVVFALAVATAGGAFWFAFRPPAHNDPSAAAPDVGRHAAGG